MVTEYGGGTDSSSCSKALTQFMDYLESNADVFRGHTIWSTGHGWGNYNLRVKPDSYQWKTVSGYLKSQGMFANSYQKNTKESSVNSDRYSIARTLSL